MIDLLFIVATLIFFFATVYYVQGCNKLLSEDKTQIND